MNSLRVEKLKDGDVDDVCLRLVYEPTVYPVNGAYRKGLTRSLMTIAYLYLKSRRCSATTNLDPRAVAVCVGAFKNELTALDAAIRKNQGWRAVPINLHELKGMDWRQVFKPAPLLLWPFLWRVFRLKGWVAVRTFAYPFVGYLEYLYFRELFSKLSSRPRVVTANLMHPLSVGIHLGARAAGLPTAFWEHAMTPRMIARDMGYDDYYVNCRHTQQSFLDAGVDARRVHMIETDSELMPTPLGDPERLMRIGVAVNDLDDLIDVESLVAKLRTLKRTVVLRIHDSDKRFTAWSEMALRHKIDVSNATQTRIADFMLEIDLMIAGNSNVILDCLRKGTRVLYFWQGDPALFDYYGIVTAVRCAYVTSLEELTELLSPGAQSSVRA